MWLNDKYDYNENIFVIDPNIHEKAKLSHADFLKRVENVKYIRTKFIDDLSFYITSIEEFSFLTDFYTIINNGKFNFEYYNSTYKTFALSVPPKLYSWFKNNSLETIQKQIICWLASCYYFNNKEILEKQLYFPVLTEIKTIIKKYFSKYEVPNILLSDKDNITEEEYDAYYENINLANKIYKNVCLEYYGSVAPEFLSKARDYEIIENWGLNERYGFSIISAYFREDDWDHIIIKGSTDDLHRAESRQDFWDKWKHTYSLYPQRKEFVFNVIESKDVRGYVYIIRQENSEIYKIGWTKKPEIEVERLATLQIGNPNKLQLIGAFKASSPKTEKTLHDNFSKQNINGEWFHLSQKDIENILSQDWRISNNIY